MNRKSIYWLSGMVAVLVLFYNMKGWSQSQAGSKAPFITHAFVVEKARYGDILKVYIEAEDPNGNMLRIATSCEQTGYGNYSTSWVYLKPTESKHFRGYLEWHTFSNSASGFPEWTQIRLRVSVFDKAGNESDAVVFPITFETGVGSASAYQAGSPFDQGDVTRLGFVNINLVNPFQDKN